MVSSRIQYTHTHTQPLTYTVTWCVCVCVGNLWYRQGLTPSYPQGSAWELISNNVTKVSVGPLDQVRPTTLPLGLANLYYPAHPQL